MLTKEELVAFVAEEAKLWQEGKIKAPTHLCGGNEEQLIEIFKEIHPHDYVLSGHRNSYHALLHGVPPNEIMEEILGTAQGKCRGRARSMGYISPSHHFYSSAIVGGMCAIGVGVAWAIAQQHQHDPLMVDEVSSKRHVWVFVGDGAVDGGHFWEALQYSIGYDLPITFVVENNNRATCTNIRDRRGGWGEDPLHCVMEFHPERVREYCYEPTYPHVGTGKYVQF